MNQTAGGFLPTAELSTKVTKVTKVSTTNYTGVKPAETLTTFSPLNVRCQSRPLIHLMI